MVGNNMGWFNRLLFVNLAGVGDLRGERKGTCVGATVGGHIGSRYS